jgi:hypothetical protein
MCLRRLSPALLQPRSPNGLHLFQAQTATLTRDQTDNHQVVAFSPFWGRLQGCRLPAAFSYQRRASS